MSWKIGLNGEESPPPGDLFKLVDVMLFVLLDSCSKFFNELPITLWNNDDHRYFLNSMDEDSSF